MPAKGIVAFAKFIVSVVFVGILINLASDSLGKRFPYAKSFLVFLAIFLAVTWLLAVVVQAVRSYLIQGRYAVEALILNSKNELLLYRHPHHKCMLPPGGRVGHFEFPNFALQRRLQERLDLNPRAYNFDEKVHNVSDMNNGNLGEVQRFATPFLIQRELHRQRRFVRFHYDLIYVLRLLDDDGDFDSPKYNPIHFFDLLTVKEMVEQKRTFPDVLDAYKRVLAIVGDVHD